MASAIQTVSGPHHLIPLLPLRERCLFPEASLEVTLTMAGAQRAVDIARRLGGRMLVIAQQELAESVANPGTQAVGTIADLAEVGPVEEGGQAVSLDGRQRARLFAVVGGDTMVGEIETLDEGDAGDDWGAAVEALARYLHAHAELRSFLDTQRRSKEPMAWVNLACQHLPITVSARQKLLESNAAERCLKISRGLDALLRKEQGS